MALAMKNARSELGEVLALDAVRLAYIKSLCSLCLHLYLREHRLYTDLNIKIDGEVHSFKRISIPTGKDCCPECEKRVFFNIS